VVPTITFQLLFAFVILSHDRRRPVHFAVTVNPTAEWTARQLLDAFPWNNAPRYLLRDRDGVYERSSVTRRNGWAFGKSCLHFFSARIGQGCPQGCPWSENPVRQRA
jgi:hypothetical protein